MSSSAGKGDSLSVSLLASSDSDNSISSEELEGGRVDTLLVNNNEVFVGSVTDLSFKFNDLHHSIVSELSLRGDEFLSLFGGGPEESRVDLSLLVLKRGIKAKDVAIFHA